MAIAWVQNVGSTGNLVASLGNVLATTTTGNLIIVVAYTNNNEPNFVKSVADGTNTYTRIAFDASGLPGSFQVWIAKNITGATTPTVTTTFSTTTAIANAVSTEVTGLALSQPIDYINWAYFTSRTGAGGYSLDTPGLKTVNNFVFAFASVPGFTATFTAGSGFSNVLSTGTSTNAGTTGTESKVIASTAPLTSIITSGAGNGAFMAVLVLSATDLPPFKGPILLNNYQQFRVPDGMSTTEKIR